MSISCRGPREPAGQQLNRSQIKPRFAAGNGRFEILRQPPVATKPAEGSLDHPAPWQYLKTFGLVRSLDDLKRPLPEPGKRGFQLFAGISAIGKEMAPPPVTTALGALLSYIIHADQKNFQPMNINFGLFPPLSHKLAKKDRGQHYAQRALKTLTDWKEDICRSKPLSQNNTV